MSVVFGRSGSSRRGKTLAAAFFVALASAALSPSAADTQKPDTLTIVLDQAQLVKLPERVATLIVGNPLIADVSIQAGSMMVITGKGYGATNLLALDRAGTVLMEKTIQVQGPRDNLVVVYRGMERETYSCAPRCERRITLGDSPAYFDSVLAQTAARTGQAQSAATVK
jgi:Flp pilus assembly secretin CpaC